MHSANLSLFKGFLNKESCFLRSLLGRVATKQVFGCLCHGPSTMHLSMGRRFVPLLLLFSDPMDNSWDPNSILRNFYPHFYLEVLRFLNSLLVSLPV